MILFPTTTSITNVSPQTQCFSQFLIQNIPATNPGQPLYIPEFQAGSYDAWGPNAPGICFASMSPDVIDMLLKDMNLAAP
jgi:hypothetical protein